VQRGGRVVVVVVVVGLGATYMNSPATNAHSGAVVNDPGTRVQRGAIVVVVLVVLVVVVVVVLVVVVVVIYSAVPSKLHSNGTAVVVVVVVEEGISTTATALRLHPSFNPE
jgi:hypothetical protein